VSAEGDAGERFGVRYGFEQSKPQDRHVNKRLRNGLWSVLYRHWPYGGTAREAIWTDWAGLALDELEAQTGADMQDRVEREAYLEPHEAICSPLEADGVLARVKKEYFGLPEDRHYRIYELVELACGGLEGEGRDEFTAGINAALANNRSVYKLANGRLERAMSKLEHDAVEGAAGISAANRGHIEKARGHMRATSPDYEASISESVKLLEHTVQALGGKGAGLGGMVRSISGRLGIHPATRDQLAQMYRFANRTSRHSEPGEEYEPDSADAKLALVWCAAMANYLVEKDAAAGSQGTQARGGAPAAAPKEGPPGAGGAPGHTAEPPVQGGEAGHTARGHALLPRQDYAGALGAFERALEIDPGSADAHHGRGRALFMAGRHGEALGAYARAIAYEPNHFMAHRDSGTALTHMGRHKEAAAAFGKACTLKPRDAEALLKRAGSLHEVGRHDEALSSCRRALELDPDNPDVHGTKADIMGSLGRHEDALESIDRAIRLDRGNGRLHVKRGMILDRLGRVSDALTAYGLAIKADPAMAEHVPQ